MLCVIGAVWIGQGTDLLHGSGMSGHGVWAVIGAVLVVIGVAVLARAWRSRGDRPA